MEDRFQRLGTHLHMARTLWDDRLHLCHRKGKRLNVDLGRPLNVKKNCFILLDHTRKVLSQ